MEENIRRDQERPEDSGESNRAILPLLQPPGNQSHRITNFYIDNILRPDFGLKGKDGTLVREEDTLGVIIRREDLTGRKPSKTVHLRQDESGGEEEHPGAPDHQHLDTETRRSDLIASDESGNDGGTGEDRCRSPQASTAPAAKPMLWPAWVYCTRYSDRPSSGWCKKNHWSLIIIKSSNNSNKKSEMNLKSQFGYWISETVKRRNCRKG